jgi:AI-2 transport protein TqsA
MPMSHDRVTSAPLLLIAGVLVCAALYGASPIIAPLAVALFVIAVVWPIQRALQTRVPRAIALAITIAGILAVVAALEYMLFWGVSRVARWMLANTDRFQSLYAQASDWLEGHGISMEAVVAGKFSVDRIVDTARTIGGKGYQLISFLAVALIFIVLGLLEVDVTRRNIEHLSNAGLRASLLAAGNDIAAKLQKYIIVRSMMSIATGAVVWLFALLAGIELATAWGVIAFVLNYIPFIGSLLSTLFPSLFALIQFESWQLALAVFIGLMVIQFIIGNYVEPRVAGATISMSPFIVLFSIFFWSFIWGIAGAFIGVPITIAVLTVCEKHESVQWVSKLLSGRVNSST